MQRLLDKLFSVSVEDANQARSMRSIMVLTLTMTLLAFVSIPSALLSPRPVSGLVTLAVASAVFFVAYFVARSGRVGLATLLLIGIIGIVILNVLVVQRQPSSGMFLCLGIIIASLTLRPLQVWLVALANMLGVLALYGEPLDVLFNKSLQSQVTLNSIWLLILTGAIGALGARELRATVGSLQHAQRAADRANAELAQANAGLEARVAARTAELDAALEGQRALNGELHDSLAAQQQLSQIIADLSLPIIPVRDDTMVVPLTGAIDSARADQLIGNVLERIEGGQVQMVILDVTGVPIVDTQVAQALLRTAEAAKLMGTRTMLVGIRPEVAQTLVGLGVNLNELRTAATLQSGLEVAALSASVPRTAASGNSSRSARQTPG